MLNPSRDKIVGVTSIEEVGFVIFLPMLIRPGIRMSQTKLGESIGVTFQQIQKYENGSNRIGASNLFKMAKALGVEVAFFYEDMPESAWVTDGSRPPGVSDQPAGEFEHDPMSSREAIELTHNFFRITNDLVRRRLFQLIKTLADSIKRQ